MSFATVLLLILAVKIPKFRESAVSMKCLLMNHVSVPRQSRLWAAKDTTALRLPESFLIDPVFLRQGSSPHGRDPKRGSGRNAIALFCDGGRVEPGGPERAGRKDTQHGRTAGTNGAGSAVDGARRPAHDRVRVMRKPCGKRERTRVADSAGDMTGPRPAISRCAGLHVRPALERGAGSGAGGGYRRTEEHNSG